MNYRWKQFNLTFLFAALFCTGVSAYASNAHTATPEEVAANFTEIFLTLRTIGTATAVVSLAVNAVKLVTGNSSQTEAAKTGIMYTLIAVACMYLIPLAVQFGKDTFSNSAITFDPGKP